MTDIAWIGCKDDFKRLFKKFGTRNGKYIDWDNNRRYWCISTRQCATGLRFDEFVLADSAAHYKEIYEEILRTRLKIKSKGIIGVGDEGDII